jgi:type II secretory pathway component PulM
MPRPHALFAAWDAASPARRAGLGALAAALVALLLLLALRPLTAAIGRAQSDVERSRSMLDVAQGRLGDSASLARTTPPLHAGDVRAAVERVMSRHDLRAAPVPADAADGRYAVVIADARFDVLVAALEALVRDEGVHVVAATLAALVEPGRVRAELTFAR